MSHQAEAVIGNTIGTLGLVGAIYGLNRMYKAVSTSTGGKTAMAIILGSVVIGTIGFMGARLQGARAKQGIDPDQLAVETLARLGQKIQKQPRDTTTVVTPKIPPRRNGG